MANKFIKVLDRPVEECAELLLGSLVTRNVDGETLIGKIVETEAYDQFDAASHSFNGQTPRTKIMFGEPGFAYVYFTYGMHYCMNVVVGKKGYGAAVLIRAVEPLMGKDFMQANRKIVTGNNLTNGPAKFTQAFLIDKALNGHDLDKYPLTLDIKPKINPSDIVHTTRIGISKELDRPWRFYIKNCPWVSKK